MLNQTTMRTILGLLAAIGALMATTATAQSAADPTGEPPIGIEEKSGAKGPALTGVLVVELVDVDPLFGLSAKAARASVRLRRGSSLATFFGELPFMVFFETDAEKAQLQADLLAVLRDDILGVFFPDDCGVLGNTCPTVELVLKKADEFGLTSDGVANQIVIMDVTVATSEPL